MGITRIAHSIVRRRGGEFYRVACMTLALFCAGAGIAAAACPGYDLRKDAISDLLGAIGKAKTGHKRVLLVLGENQCPWCQSFCRVTQRADIRALVEKSYIEFKVSINDIPQVRDFFNKNSIAFGRIPALVILDGEGNLVAQQLSTPFERGTHDNPDHNGDMIKAFLAIWPQGK